MSSPNENRVLGGYKAALHNPRVSEAAKEHAAEVLDQHGEHVSGHDLRSSTSPQNEHDKHVLAGYKSTLSNPNTSVEAKAHAREVLHEEGVLRDDNLGDDSAHSNRVLGGYKATLKNPNVSEEAKAHARSVLESHGQRVD
ncbi:hypothetical protein BOTBODRAFT_174143 [Botryobasidium botryosum FD-172 SS1]|uniref:Conidiation protein 6 n=1 Tax=Botryobasidium botryosum (strain FD-172 SS1) TaxID=930990 RepID=A0A067MIE0_BOTB1|nr:hypothetical protein BOTBODRAFT_174143 [Botryobasidium botryosum FD-172 SS1]